MRPKISVILPIYNGYPKCISSIKSIMCQTMQDFELIIINDGSDSRTSYFLNRIKNKKIKVINQTNHGLAYSLNVGLNNVKGEYITWTSHDNMYMPTAFDAMSKVLDDNINCDFVYASHKFKENKRPMIANFSVLDFIFNFSGICCFMWKKRLSDEIGYFDVNLNGIEDFDYWIRMIEKNSNVLTLKTILYTYDNSNDKTRLTNQLADKMYELEIKLANKILDRHGGYFNIKIFSEKIDDDELKKRILYSPKLAFREMFKENIYLDIK